MEEIWKDIPYYEGLYQASTFGRIRTCEGKTTFTKRHGIRHWKKRILKYKGVSKPGYRVILWKNGKPQSWLVSRLVAMTFLGESDLTVNHIDGNRLNNHIENLEWLPLKDGVRHRFKIGLYSKNCKPIRLINKETNETQDFRSMQEASKYMNKNYFYLYNHIKRGKWENEQYKWELI